ncbi:hypothetical protein D029_3394A, partial [Vibrio parahaemolyticus 970107]
MGLQTNKLLKRD